MHRKALFTISLLGLILCFSCLSNITSEQPAILKSYVHLSHTRTHSNPSMDSAVERIDFNKFDMLCLGGDLANVSSADDNTMTHIDSILETKKPYGL